MADLAGSLHGATPEQWAHDFLTAAAFPKTAANIQVVVSWEYAESGAGGGNYNPLNTTQGGYAGETNFNSVGVKNYVRYGDGIAANAKVIHNGYYPAVVAGFLVGTNARAICDAITRSPWGTGYIALRGVTTTPPPPIGHDMILIASPHKPTIAGRTAAALWDPANPNHVLLTNGASIMVDVPIGGGLRSWSPPLSPGRHGIGMMAEVGADGKPNGLGIVFQDDQGGTFNGRWS
jgi:hypothetical protein